MALEENITKKKEILEKQSYICIDAGLSQKEIESLQRIQIENSPDQFDGYGSADTELEEGIKQYLEKIGRNNKEDLECISKLIVRISREMIEIWKDEWAWTMIRVSLPNTNFNIPRWHSDGRYFEQTKKVYKLVMALKGPHTLFG